MRPIAPCKWRFRRISAGRARISTILAPSPKNRPGGGSANSRVSSRFTEDNHTQSNADSRCAKFHHTCQVSGDCAEFRKIGRNFPESRPFAAETTGWRIREPPEFDGAPKDISTQSATESWGAKHHPFRQSKWRFRCISAGRVEFP